jgi:hypothetical protein
MPLKRFSYTNICNKSFKKFYKKGDEKKRGGHAADIVLNI